MATISYDGTINTGKIAPRTLTDRIGANYGMEAIKMRAAGAAAIGKAGAELGKTIMGIGENLVTVAKNEMDKDYEIDEATAKMNFAQDQMNLIRQLDSKTFNSVEEYNRAYEEGFDYDDENGNTVHVSGINDIIKKNFNSDNFRNSFAYGHSIEKASMAARATSDQQATALLYKKNNDDRTARANLLASKYVDVGNLEGAYGAVDLLPGITKWQQSSKKLEFAGKYFQNQQKLAEKTAEDNYNESALSTILSFAEGGENSPEYLNAIDEMNNATNKIEAETIEKIKNAPKPEGVDDEQWAKIQELSITHCKQQFNDVRDKQTKSRKILESKELERDLAEYKDFKSGKITKMERWGANKLYNATQKSLEEAKAEAQREVELAQKIYGVSGSILDDVNNAITQDEATLDSMTEEQLSAWSLKTANAIADKRFVGIFDKNDVDDIKKEGNARIKLATQIREKIEDRKDAHEKAKPQTASEIKAVKAAATAQKLGAFLSDGIDEKQLAAYRQARLKEDAMAAGVEMDEQGNPIFYFNPTQKIVSGDNATKFYAIDENVDLTYDDFCNDIYQACSVFADKTEAAQKQDSILRTLKSAALVLDEQHYSKLQQVAREALDEERGTVPIKTTTEFVQNAFFQAYESDGNEKWNRFFDNTLLPNERALYNQYIQTLSKAKSTEAVIAAAETLRTRIANMRASKNAAGYALELAMRLSQANDTGKRIYSNVTWGNPPSTPVFGTQADEDAYFSQLYREKFGEEMPEQRYRKEVKTIRIDVARYSGVGVGAPFSVKDIRVISPREYYLRRIVKETN